MAKPEWGAKRLCPSCGERFYDLLRDPVDCPNCGTTYSLDQLSERKSGAAPSRAKPKPEKAAPAAAAGDALIDDEAETEDETLADDDVLLDDDEEDSDDLGEISDVAADDKEDDT
jgi:uncharacterized protein (TIGR02300 family)